MKIAKVSRVLICITVCIVTCFSQANKLRPKPNLSGTWEFDAHRSTFGDPKKYEKAPLRITIIHNDPEFTVRRKVSIIDLDEREFEYHTDGRGETNPQTGMTFGPSFQALSEIKSQTKWSGEKIVTRSNFRWPAGSIITQIQLIVEWRLSSDGKTLTKTIQTIVEDDLMSRPTVRTEIFKSVYNFVSK